jgi:hypothetical protein
MHPLGMLDAVAAEQILVVAKARAMVQKLVDLRQPLINDILEKYEHCAARANEYTVGQTSESSAFVKGTASMQNVRHTVDLDKATCSCHMWGLLGYPCAHAVAAAKAGLCTGITRHMSSASSYSHYSQRGCSSGF